MEQHLKHHLLTQQELTKLADKLGLLEDMPESHDVQDWLAILERQTQEQEPNNIIVASPASEDRVARAAHK